MSFKMITMGNFQQITSYLNLMQAIANFEYKLIYKQPIDQNELLVVWNCKQRHNELETYRFASIDVQARDKDEEVCCTLINAKVIDTGRGIIHIRGNLE
jgi:hypothetical protein